MEVEISFHSLIHKLYWTSKFLLLTFSLNALQITNFSSFMYQCSQYDVDGRVILRR